MYVADYLDVVWARLREMYGGFDSPMEFGDMLYAVIFEGKPPPERKRSKQSKGSKQSRSTPRAPKPDMAKINELRARLGRV